MYSIYYIIIFKYKSHLIFLISISFKRKITKQLFGFVLVNNYFFFF